MALSIVSYMSDVTLEKMVYLLDENVEFWCILGVKYSQKENGGRTNRICQKDRSWSRLLSRDSLFTCADLTCPSIYKRCLRTRARDSVTELAYK